MEFFDYIGSICYDKYRIADDKVLENILNYLDLNENSRCLELGCGTGNYTIGVYENISSKKNISIFGLDPSNAMLEQARNKCKNINWIFDYAENIPFMNGTFENIYTVCAIHHFKDIKIAFKEVYRILKDNGKFMIFTCFHKQIEGYWLKEYFPGVIEKAKEYRPDFDKVELSLKNAGFKNLHTEIYFTDRNTKDSFPNSMKHKPEMYLDENFRYGMSMFSSYTNQIEIKNGCKRLKEDISTGRIIKIIDEYDKQYSKKNGDYTFVMCQK